MPSLVFDELAATVFGGVASFGEVGERAPLPARAPSCRRQPRPVAATSAAERRSGEHFLGTLRLLRYRPLFSGPAVERVPELQFQRPAAEVELAARRRRAPPDRDRRHGHDPLQRNVGRASRPGRPEPRRRRRPRRGRARGRPPPRRRGGEGMTEPWWISVIKSLIIINLVLVGFAYLTLAERKVMGRMQLRYGPNRAGPYGLLQPIADLVKLIRKESFFPASAVDVLYIASPFLAAFTALVDVRGDPLRPGLGDRRLPGRRLGRRRPDRADPHLRDRLARHLRLHRRRLGLRLEVRAPRRRCAPARSSSRTRSRSRSACSASSSWRSSLSLTEIVAAPGRDLVVRRAAVRRLRRLPARRHRRDGARAVRPPRGRAGARRRLPHRVRRDALRPLHDEPSTST